MGQNFCGEAPYKVDPERLKIKDGIDANEKDIDHQSAEMYKDQRIKDILDPIVENVERNRTMYKDTNMPSDPLILKTNDRDDIMCTFERPYIFLNEVKKGVPYQVYDPLIQ